MNIYLEGSLQDTMMALEKEFIFGNVKSVNIYGLIAHSKRKYYNTQLVFIAWGFAR
tara:strand:+ start:690 stop:857 length:168 start_codon:yes stop_codon:yes gene_type:complete